MARKKAVGNGEGSIVAIRRNGKIAGYAPEITIGWKDGKRIRKRGPIKRTRGDARAALDVLKQQNTVALDQVEASKKVRDYFPYWLEKSFTPRARGRSVDTYRWAIDGVIVPRLGDLTLGKVSTLRLDDVFAELLEGGMEARSVQLVRTVLNSGFKQARKWGLVAHNPVTDTQSPKISPSCAKALTDAQAAAFLKAAQGERLELALQLALMLGLRRGEVCGLRWSDIDLEAGTITVNGSLGYIKGQGLVYGPPKTKSGVRRFNLPVSMLANIKRHHARSATERKAMEHWQPSDYVFVSTRNGGPLNPGQLYDTFREVAQRAGLTGFRLHDLRHSAASMLHAEGVPVKTISAYLGHADTSITNDIYVHLFADALSDAAAIVEARLAAESE